MPKTKSLHAIEERMENLDPGSFRYQVLDAAKRFKSSWIELGQHLFSVYKDKLFKEWGYLTFEAYCAKEIGVRQNTALKLLKSYSFLEKEEPTFLKREALDDRQPSRIPGYESVNALRLAKQSERISEKEYQGLREEVFDEGREEAEVKKKIRYVLKSHPPAGRAGAPARPEEDRKTVVVKRLISSLKTARDEMTSLDFPNKMTKQIDALIQQLLDFEK